MGVPHPVPPPIWTWDGVPPPPRNVNRQTPVKTVTSLVLRTRAVKYGHRRRHLRFCVSLPPPLSSYWIHCEHFIYFCVDLGEMHISANNEKFKNPIIKHDTKIEKKSRIINHESPVCTTVKLSLMFLRGSNFLVDWRTARCQPPMKFLDSIAPPILI